MGCRHLVELSSNDTGDHKRAREADADGPRSVLRPRGEVVGAQVVGVDRETDLALLKLQLDRPLPTLELGDAEDLRPGELLFVIRTLE